MITYIGKLFFFLYLNFITYTKWSLIDTLNGLAEHPKGKFNTKSKFSEKGKKKKIERKKEKKLARTS